MRCFFWTVPPLHFLFPSFECFTWFLRCLQNSDEPSLLKAATAGISALLNVFTVKCRLSLLADLLVWSSAELFAYLQQQSTGGLQTLIGRDCRCMSHLPRVGRQAGGIGLENEGLSGRALQPPPCWNASIIFPCICNRMGQWDPLIQLDSLNECENCYLHFGKADSICQYWLPVLADTKSLSKTLWLLSAAMLAGATCARHIVQAWHEPHGQISTPDCNTSPRSILTHMKDARLNLLFIVWVLHFWLSFRNLQILLCPAAVLCAEMCFIAPTLSISLVASKKGISRSLDL